MINFTHKQVINDSFMMSFLEFFSFYQENYGLTELECKIIWEGIRENVSEGDYSIIRSNRLSKEEFEEIKKEVLSGVVQEKGVLKEKKFSQDEVERIMNDPERKTKKKKFFGLKEIGLTDNEAAQILKVSEAYLKYLVDEFRQLDRE